jgi:hypothetical protein
MSTVLVIAPIVACIEHWKTVYISIGKLGKYEQERTTIRK